MASLWIQHPLAVLGFLGFLNLVLGIYILKSFLVMTPSHKRAVEKKTIITKIKSTKNSEEKKTLVKAYEEKGFAQEDLQSLNSGKKKTRYLALKRLAVLSSPAYLYDITKVLDDKDDLNALYAFRAVLQQSNAVGIQLLQKVLFRGDKKKLLLVSSFYKLAKANPQILLDVLSMEVAEWIFIACVKSLARVNDPRLMPVLVNAQEHSSEKIQSCAKAILDKMMPPENVGVA